MKIRVRLPVFILILTGVLCLITSSCTKYNSALEVATQGNILLLRIDYMSHAFESGTELKIATTGGPNDSLPIRVDYKSPGDFGNISFYYQPGGDLIFDGSIIWMGTGKISFPKSFTPGQNYSHLNVPLAMPDISQFQSLFANQAADLPVLWKPISELKLVSIYLKYKKKIGFFLYTPSVGFGNPYEWDWFIIMSK